MASLCVYTEVEFVVVVTISVIPSHLVLILKKQNKMFRQMFVPHCAPNHPLNVVLRQRGANISKNFTTCSSATSRVLNSQVAGREIDLLQTSRDTRFNLPGNVGINKLWLDKLKSINNNENDNIDNIASKKTTEEKSPFFSTSTDEILRSLEEEKSIPNANMFLADERSILNCDAHECPLLLMRDFQELFPRDFKRFTHGMTVLTLTHKSKNDMSAWSSEVDSEREELIEKFVVTAKRMCSFLTKNGFWADFVDPSSGRPFYVSFCYFRL